MAAKSNGNGQTAGGRLETLRAQIAVLLARRQELGSVTGKPDTADPLGSAAKAGAAGAEQAAIDKALPLLEAEARAAEAQLRVAREAEAAAAAERMRREVPAKLAEVIKAAQALGTALDALAGHEQAISALGGWVQLTYGDGLRHALGGALGAWRREWPELLGLPPKPTATEAALADARAELERAHALLEQTRGIQPGPRWELAGDIERMTKDREAQVQRAEQRVRDLEEAGKTPRARPQPVKAAGSVEVVTLPEGRGQASYWED